VAVEPRKAVPSDVGGPPRLQSEEFCQQQSYKICVGARLPRNAMRIALTKVRSAPSALSPPPRSDFVSPKGRMWPRFPDGCGGREIGAIAYPQGQASRHVGDALIVALVHSAPEARGLKEPLKSSQPASRLGFCKSPASGLCLGRYRCALRLSSVFQRSTNPNQNALSLPLRAAVARRRHSLALCSNTSVLVILWPPLKTPAAALTG
jgi:hypothetical protein